MVVKVPTLASPLPQYGPAHVDPLPHMFLCTCLVPLVRFPLRALL